MRRCGALSNEGTDSRKAKVRAAILDMDGTIYDAGIDWLDLRKRIGLPRDGRPILKQLEDVDPEVRRLGTAILVDAERRGAREGRLIPGAIELLRCFRRHGVSCALVTNNSRDSAETVLRRHPLPFDLVLTRDEGAAKPEPGVFLDALRMLGTSPAEAISIGDAHLDAIAAHRAGIPNIILVGVPGWMQPLVPRGARYEVADNLQDVVLAVERLLSP